MSRTPYIFTQLTGYMPKDIFDRLVKRHNSNVEIKSYTCWNKHYISIISKINYHYCPIKVG